MKFYTLLLFISYLTLFVYLALFIGIFQFVEWKILLKTIFHERTFHSICLSLVAASLAAVLAITLAIPTAFTLSRKDFFLKKTVDVILEFPMVVSPAALGALVLIFFQTRLGVYIRENLFDPIYSFQGIVLAQFITVLGIAVRLIKAVFDEIPRRY